MMALTLQDEIKCHPDAQRNACNENPFHSLYNGMNGSLTRFLSSSAKLYLITDALALQNSKKMRNCFQLGKCTFLSNIYRYYTVLVRKKHLCLILVRKLTDYQVLTRLFFFYETFPSEMRSYLRKLYLKTLKNATAVDATKIKDNVFTR